MSATLFLNPETWDLELGSDGNIAVATDTYQQAQDICSAGRTFLGEAYYNKSLGIPYFEDVLGTHGFPLALYKMYLENAALSIGGVESASAILGHDLNRKATGYIAFTNSDNEQGQISL